MRLEEIFTGFMGIQGTIDGGLALPATPAYGEEKYGMSDAGKKKVYDDATPREDSEEEFTVAKKRFKGKIKRPTVDDKQSDNDEVDSLPNASDYALGLGDQALINRL